MKATDRELQVKIWRLALIPLAVALIAILAAYWGTAAEMVQIWARSDTFAHAFVVPPISVWLAWRQRERLLEITPTPAPWALIPVALAAVAWLLGETVAVNALTQFALVAMLVGSVVAVLGTAVGRAILFPLVFLFFAVPVGEFMVPTLMQWTADFTVFALRLIGIPVYREGLNFVIPTGSWSVVETCSGMRYLIASFMVGSLFAHLNYRSPSRRWVFVGLSLLVPILANWLRALMIVMLGHLSNNKIATGVDHLVYGWVLFGVIILVLFMIGSRWTELDGTELAPSADFIRPQVHPDQTRTWIVGLAASLVIASPIAVQRLLTVPKATPLTKTLAVPDLSSNGWREQPIGSRWQPVYKLASASSAQEFVNSAGQRAGLYVFYYRDQDKSRKLIASTNVLVQGEDSSWNPLDRTRRTLDPVAEGGERFDVDETILLAAGGSVESERERLRIWRLYWINGRWTSSEVKAKWFAAIDRLRGRADDSAAVIVFASDRQPGGAEKALTSFLQPNLKLIEAELATMRDGRP